MPKDKISFFEQRFWRGYDQKSHSICFTIQNYRKAMQGEERISSD